jgi:DNA-binding MarR family transcriptional regulator
MDAVAIKQIRSFNRTVAEGIGALDDRFLGRARPMAEARVLWEIGTAGADLHGLRARLGLDSANLNRILRSLERQRLVRFVPDDGDRRTRRAALTNSGVTERAELDRRSDAVALRMLDPLSDHQRQAFVAAVAEVERLLQASMARRWSGSKPTAR